MAAVADLRAHGYDISNDHLILTGTSRGGAVAIRLALEHPDVFQRVGVVSGARPFAWTDDLINRAKGTHFFMVHGKEDNVIKLETVQDTVTQLTQHGAIVRVQIIDGAGHNLNSAAYSQVLDWISPDSNNEKKVVP
jgi:predicted esterase